ncbi:hypothetical protein [Spiroplasma endosymbiont of Dioctria linearis]|uniref:hypothetical protein n=1 Tax=Spiroplasma endosymbiont of Dioctria linearis TaxID=3066290 RepID=UPI00313D8DCB
MIKNESNKINYKDFKLNHENDIILILTISGVFSLLVLIIFLITFTFLNFNIIYLLGLFLFVILFIVLFFINKKIFKNLRKINYQKNYQKLLLFNWTDFYKKNSIKGIEILNVNINAFFIPIKNLFVKNDLIFSDNLNIIDEIMNEEYFQKNLKVNNTIKFRILKQEIEISYMELFLEERTNKIYCKVKVKLFNTKHENVVFNDLSEFLNTKKKYKLENSKKDTIITFYKKIDRYNDLDNLDELHTSENRLINTISVIPGLFSMRKMNNKNFNKKMIDIVKKDCLNLKTFNFLDIF